jgi:hypothetical protein
MCAVHGSSEIAQALETSLPDRAERSTSTELRTFIEHSPKFAGSQCFPSQQGYSTPGKECLLWGTATPCTGAESKPVLLTLRSVYLVIKQ